MNLAAVVEQVRSNVATLATRVFGVAELLDADFETPEGVVRPCAFVMPTEDESVQETTAGGVVASIEYRFAVIIAVSNTAADDGFTGANAIDALRTEVINSLHGWQYTGHAPVRYVRGRYLGSNRVTYMWACEFAVTKWGGSSIEWEVRTQLEIDAGVGIATVLGTLSTAIATATGATRYAQDWAGNGYDATTVSTTRFTMQAIGSASRAIDAMNDRTTVTVAVRFTYHLAAGAVDRTTYTEAAMQTQAAAVLDVDLWRVTGVFAVLDDPSLDFPSDIARTF